MDISQTRAFYGIRSVATPTSAYITNDVSIGIPNATNAITDVDTIFAAQGLIVGASSMVISSDDNDSIGTTSWTAGSAQIETAVITLDGGAITVSGNAKVTVTADGLPGSPKIVSVPLLQGDAVNVVAGKFRSALIADLDVSLMFDVSGTGSNVVLTRKPKTYTVAVDSIPVYYANDATLNMAIADITSVGITPSPTSVDTAAGVASDGVYLVDADGKDFEGNILTTIATGRQGAYIIRNDSVSTDDVLVTSTAMQINLPPAGGIQFWANNCDGAVDTFTIDGTSGEALVSFISCGATT